MFYSIALHLLPLNNIRRQIIDIISTMLSHFVYTDWCICTRRKCLSVTITKLEHVQCLITQTSNTTRSRGKIRRLLTHNFTYLHT